MCVVEDDNDCTGGLSCKFGSLCTANKTNSTIYHCKAKSATGNICGTTTTDGESTGTPIACKESDDFCPTMAPIVCTKCDNTCASCIVADKCSLCAAKHYN